MFKYLFELRLKKSSFYKSEKVILKERTYFVHQCGDRNKIDLSFVTGIFSVCFQKCWLMEILWFLMLVSEFKWFCCEKVSLHLPLCSLRLLLLDALALDRLWIYFYPVRVMKPIVSSLETKDTQLSYQRVNI